MLSKLVAERGAESKAKYYDITHQDNLYEMFLFLSSVL